MNPAPFASVAKLGNGFVVFIAGGVSSDTWLERRADNHMWLSNTAKFLLSEVERERQRSASHLRSPFLLFFSHRSVDKEFVSQVARTVKQSGLGIWIDEEQLIASDSLVEEISRALQRMTHFVLFWSSSCVGAPWVQRELNAAVSLLLGRNVPIPILIVRLDETPVPPIVADLLRIEGMGRSPSEVAESIVSTINRLRRRAGAATPDV